MNPFLQGPGRLLSYLAAWLLFGALFAAGLAASGGMTLPRALLLCPPLALLLSVLGLSCWFLVRTLPLAEAPRSRLVGTWFTAGCVLLLLWVTAALGWRAVLGTAGISFTAEPAAMVPALLLIGLAGLLVTVLGLYALEALQRSHESERRALELQALAREVETSFLRRQLDPHFLFNSLNSIAALIGTDGSAARRMCFLLAEFFRGSLKFGAHKSISVAQELALVEAFLAIEQVRFGERLRVHIDAQDQARALAVPALLLQPLVENAVHHGIAHLIEGGDVTISAQLRDGRLALAVTNACDPDRPTAGGTGVGLANVRGRIEALFGRLARVEVDSTAEQFRVLILLPAIPAESTSATTATGT